MAESSKEPEWHPNSETMRPIKDIDMIFSEDSYKAGGKGTSAHGHVYRPGSIPAASPDVREKEDTGIITVWKKATDSPLLEREIPRRPGYGQGQPKLLYTNHFHLNAAKAETIYKYHVEIGELVNLRDGKKRKAKETSPTPSGSMGLTQAPTKSAVSQPGARPAGDKLDTSQEKPQRGLIRKLRRLFEILLQHPVLKAAGEAVVTDYAGVVFTAKELDLTKEIQLFYSAEQGGRESTGNFKVKIKLGEKLDVGSLTEYLSSPFTAQKAQAGKEIIQALNTIMKHSPSTESDISIGTDNSKFYHLSGESGQLCCCVVALKGYYASMRTSTARLLINLNVCTSAFYQEGRVDVIMTNLRGTGNLDWAQVETFLKKRRVSTNYLGSKRFKIICGFLPRPTVDDVANGNYHTARSLKFTPPDKVFEGKDVTVEYYFEVKHKIKLEHPDLPLLNFGVLKDKATDTTNSTDTSTSTIQQIDAKSAEPPRTLPDPRHKKAELTSSSSTHKDMQQKETTAVKPRSIYPIPLQKDARIGKAASTHLSTQTIGRGKAEPSGSRGVIDQKGKRPEEIPACEKRYELVPPELCCLVPGQVYSKKLGAQDTKRMVGFAARPPAENARRIVGAAKDVFDLTSHNSKLKAFGLRVSPELITVEGRSLKAPRPSYGKESFADVELGSWNLKDGQKLSENAKVQRKQWSCLYQGKRGQAPVGRICELLDVHFTNCGLALPGAKEHQLVVKYFPAWDSEDIDQSIKEALGDFNPGIKILFVVLNNDDAYVYSRLKSISELEFGIHTVCTTRKNFDKKWGASKEAKDLTYGTNLALKFNLKMKGINHTLDGAVCGKLNNTMVIGIDVSHPSNTKLRNAKSIAGVVANTGDRDFSQWPCSLRTQEGGQEIVDSLKDMVIERLKLWSVRTNGGSPERIIVYRDGVSEDQYDEVLKLELARIRKACVKVIPKGSEVPIALVIVAKRHHVRFYPTEHKDTDKSVNWNRKGNPMPGTVVERGVTMETGWDFYLQAHDCIQGTAKPAHYVVLHSDFDKQELNATKLQEITHEFSYLFGRATKAISVCAPAYYAHLACERGKVYLHKYYQVPEATANGKNPEWDDKGNQWKRTICEKESTKEGVVNKDPLADDMFYI